MFNVVMNHPIHPRVLDLLRGCPIAYSIVQDGEAETKAMLVDHIRQQVIDKIAQRNYPPLPRLQAPAFIQEEMTP